VIKTAKGLMLVAFLVIVAIVLTGCGNNNGNDNGYISVEELLVGRWDIEDSTVDLSIMEDGLIFSEDGTGEMLVMGMDVPFTWEIDEDGYLAVTIMDVTSEYYIVEITESKLVIEIEVPVYGLVRTTYSR